MFYCRQDLISHTHTHTHILYIYIYIYIYLFIYLFVYIYKVKFTLEQATNAQRGSKGIVLFFSNLPTRWGG